jgi:hypothetical protein
MSNAELARGAVKALAALRLEVRAQSYRYHGVVAEARELEYQATRTMDEALRDVEAVIEREEARLGREAYLRDD